MLILFLLALQAVQARPFNITHFIVPEIVPPGQHEVELECKYDANFTILNWFKGHNEFFRYKPGAAPSTRSFPILGVGQIELITCGPTACRLRLGALTEEASGLYRCDIEHETPPYKYETRKAYMQVHGHIHRKPLLEGLAEQYGEGDDMQAYCRGAPDAELRWYINGREIEEMRGSATLKQKSSRLLFLGVPPMVTVQCAEFRHGKLTGSKDAKARWNELGQIRGDERAQEHRNSATCVNIVLPVLLLVLLVAFLL